MPKSGVVSFKDNEDCGWCWRSTQLYVERGQLIIGGIRKPVDEMGASEA